MATQIPFGTGVEVATNPEPRCPCILLVDISESMEGQRIAELQEGLQTYRTDLLADSQATQRVEVAVVTFGGHVEVASPFATAEQFTHPHWQ